MGSLYVNGQEILVGINDYQTLDRDQKLMTAAWIIKNQPFEINTPYYLAKMAQNDLGFYISTIDMKIALAELNK